MHNKNRGTVNMVEFQIKESLGLRTEQQKKQWETYADD